MEMIDTYIDNQFQLDMFKRNLAEKKNISVLNQKYYLNLFNVFIEQPRVIIKSYTNH